MNKETPAEVKKYPRAQKFAKLIKKEETERLNSRPTERPQCSKEQSAPFSNLQESLSTSRRAWNDRTPGIGIRFF